MKLLWHCIFYSFHSGARKREKEGLDSCTWSTALQLAELFNPSPAAQGPVEPVVKYQHLAGRTIKRGKDCLILHTFRCLSLTSHFVRIFEQTFWFSSIRVIQWRMKKWKNALHEKGFLTSNRERDNDGYSNHISTLTLWEQILAHVSL